MDKQIENALLGRLIAMADDELILAHRNSEWTGHAPILEEDIALANLAQDELGHATTIYGLVEQLNGRSPDNMAFFRDADEFRNAQLTELPKGDWAFTMLRQYLFDAYEHVLYTALLSSTHQPLADVVAKFKGEELYHLRHSHMWVERLGLGTAESQERTQRALNQLWPFALQLFRQMLGDEALIENNLFPDVTTLKESWEQIVIPHLEACQLTIPTENIQCICGRDTHTPNLAELLADMQQVARWDPGATW